MTDADYRAQKKRVQALAARWEPSLGLRWWRLTYTWFREPFEDKPRVAMQCGQQYEYRCANIDVSLPLCADMDDDALEHYLLHEYGHILLDAMATYRELGEEPFRLQEEHTATTLATIFQWVREAGREDERKSKKKAA
jgi:hypothetical protein